MIQKSRVSVFCVLVILWSSGGAASFAQTSPLPEFPRMAMWEAPVWERVEFDSSEHELSGTGPIYREVARVSQSGATLVDDVPIQDGVSNVFQRGSIFSVWKHDKGVKLCRYANVVDAKGHQEAGRVCFLDVLRDGKVETRTLRGRGKPFEERLANPIPYEIVTNAVLEEEIFKHRPAGVVLTESSGSLLITHGSQKGPQRRSLQFHRQIAVTKIKGDKIWLADQYSSQDDPRQLPTPEPKRYSNREKATLDLRSGTAAFESGGFRVNFRKTESGKIVYKIESLYSDWVTSPAGGTQVSIGKLWGNVYRLITR